VDTWKVALGMLAVAAVLGLVVFLLSRGGSTTERATTSSATATPTTSPAIAGPGEIILQPSDAVGPSPFTEPVVPTVEEIDEVAAEVRSVAVQPVVDTIADPASGEAASIEVREVRSVSGAAPGLYGGTNEIDVCDRGQLTGFLESNPEKAAAWAEVHGLDVADIPGFIDGLTDVVLRRDLRVTNHGFRDGRANGFNAVLEAGTAVLVDDFGVPRVRCACGNPLAEPAPVEGAATYVGRAWDTFEPEEVIAVLPTEEVEEFVLVDAEGSAPLYRVPGSVAAAAAAEPRIVPAVSVPATTVPATTVPATTVPATTVPATTVPAPPLTTAPATTTAATTAPETVEPLSDITRSGSIGATSTFGGFPASFAVDGDLATSWFSDGSTGGDSEVFEWRPGEGTPAFVSGIELVGNQSHANGSFRSGFGFARAVVEVRDDHGDSVLIADLDLSAANPAFEANALLPINMEVTAIRIIFIDHQDPACGGFAELIVIGR